MFGDIFEDRKEKPLQIGPNDTSLTLLQVIYRNPATPLHTRIRCAMACLPFEHPKLQVTAVVQENDLASLLDARLKRMAERTKVIERNANSGHNGTDVNLLPRLADRRFRRM